MSAPTLKKIMKNLVKFNYLKVESKWKRELPKIFPTTIARIAV